VLPQTIQPGEVTLCKRHLNIFTGAKDSVGLMGRVGAGVEPDSLAAQNGCAIPPLG